MTEASSSDTVIGLSPRPEAWVTFPVNGKVPLVAGWQALTASVPHDGNYGRVVPDGYVVIDIDPEGLEWLAKSILLLSPTYTVQTPRGGWHMYYALPLDVALGNSAGRISRGVDVRARGGYVLGPGSKGYTLVNDVPMAELPAEIVALARPIVEDTGDAIPASSVQLSSHVSDAAIAYLQKQPRLPRKAGNGMQNRLFIVCMHLTRSLCISPQEALPLLKAHYTDLLPGLPWPDDELERKLTEAAEKGKFVVGDALADVEAAALLPLTQPKRMTAAEIIGSHLNTIDLNGEHNEFRNLEKPRRADIDEICIALSTFEMSGVIRYNELLKRTTLINPPDSCFFGVNGKPLTNGDLTNLERFLIKFRQIIASRGDLINAVESLASRHPFNPRRDYFNSLERIPAVEAREFLVSKTKDLFGDPREVAGVFFKNLLVGAVARIYKPGYAMRNLVVLYGPQKYGKTRTLKTLFGEEFYKEITDIEHPDTTRELHSFLIGDITELNAMKTDKQREYIKAYTSKNKDNFRRPYERLDETHYRMFVLAGTTNNPQFLSDQTGNDRFHPIEVCEKVDFNWLEANVNNLWSAAVSLYEAGETLELTEAEDHDADFLRSGNELDDPRETAILTVMDRFRGKGVSFDTFLDAIRTAAPEFCKDMVGISSILVKHGCKKHRALGKGPRVWLIPEKHETYKVR